MNFFKVNKKVIATYLAVVASLQIGGSAIAAVASDNLYKKIGDSYLQSFQQISADDSGAVDSKNTEFKSVVLSDNEQRKILFEVLQKNIPSDEASSVLGSQVWKDLEFFRGEGVDQSKHLFSKINRTETKIGEVVLAKMLATPSNDKDTLQRSQKVVRAIVEDKGVFETLDRCLKKAREAESQFLAFQSCNQNEMPDSSSFYFSMGSRFKALDKHLAHMNEKFNASPLVLEGAVQAKHLFNIMKTVSYFQNKMSSANQSKIIRYYNVLEKYPFIQKSMFYSGSDLDRTSKFSIIELIGKASKSSMIDAVTLYDLRSLINQAGSESQRDGFFYWHSWIEVIAFITWIKDIRDSYVSEKNFLKQSKYLRDKMVAIVSYLDSIRESVKIVSDLRGEPFPKHLEYLFKQDESISDKLNSLINLLSTNTFKGESSFFSLTGRVLAAFTLMESCKDELVGAMEALGEVDAYLSIAKLYKEHADKPAHYAFAQFVENDTPYVKLTNFWNPFIDPEVVITNSVELGGDSACNTIITGPNAGGKSTALTGITMNLLLAQSFGIAPADEVVMTPFTRINTYLNIADDKAMKSLFEAEVMQAQKLINSIEELPCDQFSFTIMDEIFSGTNPVEAEAAAYGVSKSLAKNANSICMIATHFPKLTDLEKTTSAYANYKVSVTKNSDGSLTYPYLLQRGITNQRIALDILRDRGFDSDLIKEAQELVDAKTA